MALGLIENAFKEKKPIVVFLKQRKVNLMRPTKKSKTLFIEATVISQTLMMICSPLRSPLLQVISSDQTKEVIQDFF